MNRKNQQRLAQQAAQQAASRQKQQDLAAKQLELQQKRAADQSAALSKTAESTPDSVSPGTEAIPCQVPSAGHANGSALLSAGKQAGVQNSRLEAAPGHVRIEDLIRENASLREDIELQKLLLAEAPNERKKFEEEQSTRRQQLEQEIRDNEAVLRQAFREAQRREIADLQANAQEEAKKVLADATSSASATMTAALGDADALVKGVGNKASELLEEAERVKLSAIEEASKTVAAAKQEQREIVAQGRLKAAQATTRHEEELAAREVAVAERDRESAMQEAQLSSQSEDLDMDRKYLNLFKEKYERRWEECSPGRVKDLELQVASVADVANTYQTKAKAAQDEVVRLSALLAGENGQGLDALLEDLDRTKRRVRELNDTLSGYPAADQLEVMRLTEDQNVELRREVRTVRARLLEAEARALRVELGNREMKQMQAQVDGLRALNDDLQKQLNQNTEALQGRSGERFPELIGLDARPPRPRSGRPAATGSLLKNIVTHVRSFAASRPRPLYYSEATIRAFLAGMATSRLAILQGLSGTGKSSLPRVFAEAIAGECVSIPVQSNWRDRHELLGYNNDFTRKFSETDFTKAVYEAGLPHEEETPWIVVLDEMNLARIEYYFADFLSALELPDEARRRVSLLSYDPAAFGEKSPRFLEGGQMRIPTNLWFVGTANQDESTFEITDKVYDRAQVIEFREREVGFRPSQNEIAPLRVSSGSLRGAFESAQASTGGLELEDWDYVHRIDDFLSQRLGITFGHRVEEQMRTFTAVFVAAGGAKHEAVDMHLARKVFRKLETRHDHDLPAALSDLKALMQKVAPAGYGPLSFSLDVLERKAKQIGGSLA